jgi:hypothetical protein
VWRTRPTRPSAVMSQQSEQVRCRSPQRPSAKSSTLRLPVTRMMTRESDVLICYRHYTADLCWVWALSAVDLADMSRMGSKWYWLRNSFYKFRNCYKSSNGTNGFQFFKPSSSGSYRAALLLYHPRPFRVIMSAVSVRESHERRARTEQGTVH